MAGLSIQAASAIHEEAEADIVQPQRIIYCWLREICAVPSALLPQHIGSHAAAGRRLREQVVRTTCRRHGCEELIEDPEIAGNRCLDRHLLWREHRDSCAILRSSPPSRVAVALLRVWVLVRIAVFGKLTIEGCIAWSLGANVRCSSTCDIDEALGWIRRIRWNAMTSDTIKPWKVHAAEEVVCSMVLHVQYLGRKAQSKCRYSQIPPWPINYKVNLQVDRRDKSAQQQRTQ